MDHSDSSDALEQLIQGLQDRNPATRQKAREQLEARGPSAAEAVAGLLDHDQTYVRWEAAKTLVALGHPDTVEPLVQRLGDSVADVRWVAGEALISIGEAALRPTLRALASDDARQLMEGAHHVLHDMAVGPQKTLLQPVLDAYRASEPEVAVPVAALQALQNLPE